MSITGTGTVADPYVVNSTFTEVDGSTSNETVTGLSFDGSVITLSEGGNTDKTVDISGVSTDDQTASEVTFIPTGNTSSTEVQSAIEELQTEIDGFSAIAGQTNTASNVGGGVGIFARKNSADLEFKSLNAASNKLSIIDDTANDEVDIDINEANLTITESQISDLNHTIDTDDQTATEVSYDNTLSGLTSTNTQSAIDEVASESSDDQNLESATLDTDNILSLGIEDGTGATVDLSPLDESAEVTALDGRVTANATDIGSNSTSITNLDGRVTTNATAISDHIAADGDLDGQNEIQDLELSGNELKITNNPSAT
ncbi:hypothetical protein, partial [Galbibacter pacificus]